MKKNEKPGLPARATVALGLTVIAATILFTMANTLPTLAVLAVIPPVLVGLGWGLLRVHPRHLQTLGWSLVASNLTAFAALLLGLC